MGRFQGLAVLIFCSTIGTVAPTEVRAVGALSGELTVGHLTLTEKGQASQTAEIALRWDAVLRGGWWIQTHVGVAEARTDSAFLEDLLGSPPPLRRIFSPVTVPPLMPRGPLVSEPFAFRRREGRVKIVHSVFGRTLMGTLEAGTHLFADYSALILAHPHYREVNRTLNDPGVRLRVEGARHATEMLTLSHASRGYSAAFRWIGRLDSIGGMLPTIELTGFVGRERALDPGGGGFVPLFEDKALALKVGVPLGRLVSFESEVAQEWRETEGISLTADGKNRRILATRFDDPVGTTAGAVILTLRVFGDPSVAEWADWASTGGRKAAADSAERRKGWGYAGVVDASYLGTDFSPPYRYQDPFDGIGQDRVGARGRWEIYWRGLGAAVRGGRFSSVSERDRKESSGGLDLSYRSVRSSLFFTTDVTWRRSEIRPPLSAIDRVEGVTARGRLDFDLRGQFTGSVGLRHDDLDLGVFDGSHETLEGASFLAQLTWRPRPSLQIALRYEDSADQAVRRDLGFPPGSSLWSKATYGFDLP